MIKPPQNLLVCIHPKSLAARSGLDQITRPSRAGPMEHHARHFEPTIPRGGELDRASTGVVCQGHNASSGERHAWLSCLKHGMLSWMRLALLVADTRLSPCLEVEEAAGAS